MLGFPLLQKSRSFEFLFVKLLQRKYVHFYVYLRIRRNTNRVASRRDNVHDIANPVTRLLYEKSVKKKWSNIRRLLISVKCKPQNVILVSHLRNIAKYKSALSLLILLVKTIFCSISGREENAFALCYIEK